MPKGIPKNKASRKQLMVVGGGKRNILQREEDIHYAMREYAKGKSIYTITDELNARNPEYQIEVCTLDKDIKAAMVEWKRENMDNVEMVLARETMRLDHIEQVVWENFEKSKMLRPNDYAALMKRGMSIEEIDELYQKENGEKLTAGDASYLQILLNLHNQRLKMYGLDKGNDFTKQTVVNYNFGDINIGDLANIADQLQDRHFQEIEDAKIVEE